ncbi:MAG TPA: alanine racemase [Thermoanaerobaculia bacterium]|nr:alanine racemase [Thermoanaerobaculia bacterium]
MSIVPEPGGRPTWAEIDLGSFTRNIDHVVSSLPAGSRLIAVLKADAYGHGAVEVARTCREDRVAMIATALLEEALELRRAGIALPLLVLGPLDVHGIRTAAAARITVGVPGPETLSAACSAARDLEVRIHLKLDSGMGRMGLTAVELPAAVEMIRSAPGLSLDAIYTHYANADSVDDPYTGAQDERFRAMLTELRAGGVDAPLHHSANSAAVLRGHVTPGDFVRAGIALYGGDPLGGGTSLEPVMRWRTEIARLKTLPSGHAIGYGTTFHTKRPSRIATLPVGYADGYNRLHSNRGEVLVRGRRAPVVGRVSMDLVTIDVTDVPGVAVGDEVMLLGPQGDDRITAEEVAARIGTINYEVFCSVSARVPRIYRGEGPVRMRSRFA